MKLRILALLAAMCLLTGCAPLLEREYSTSEPHSSKFWESDAAGTLRAENHQDVVNDLLLLIGEYRDTATLRLYHFEDDVSVADTLEQAAVEIQQETPLGAYAVEYITSSFKEQRGYYEVQIQIGYRRTEEQLERIVSATAPEAIYSLLNAALDSGQRELAVRIGYWGMDGQKRAENTISQLRKDRQVEDAGWTVNCYPESGNVRIVEILMDVPPELPPEEETPVEENAEVSAEAAETPVE